jgi:Zn-dependent alcohol dehydrogenase
VVIEAIEVDAPRRGEAMVKIASAASRTLWNKA